MTSASSLSIPEQAQARREFALKHLLPEDHLHPFIGGRFIANKSAATIDLVDPFTQRPYAHLEVASDEVVAAAVKAAEAGSAAWTALHPRDRGRCMFRLAELIESRYEALALLEAIDTGKRYAGTRGWDILNAAEVYRYYAGWADKIQGGLLPSARGQRIEERPQPAGVVAAIVPWNFPFPCIAWKIGPALAAGCSVVLKASERAPLSAQVLAGLVLEAGFPPGVVNVVAGDGRVGEALVANPAVARVTFTGHVNTALKIQGIVGARFVQPTLELGGKSASVVFDDADMDRAAAGTFEGLFSVAGQNCCATNRVIVHRSRRDELIERLAAMAETTRLGDNLEDSTDQGPQIDAAHLSNIDGFVQRAVENGATCEFGGSPLAPFYPATLLTGADPQSEISQQEAFGPVGSLDVFDDEDEALALSNNTAYGLAASLWTQNRPRITRLSRELLAGTVWVNCFGYFDTVAPWGGLGMSGTGRELGRAAIDEFVAWRTVLEVD